MPAPLSEVQSAHMLIGCPMAFKFCSRYMNEDHLPVCFCSSKPTLNMIKAMEDVVKNFTTHECDILLLHLQRRIWDVCSSAPGNEFFQNIIRRASADSIDTLLHTTPVERLMRHPYGSAVMQTLLEANNGKFIPAVLKHISSNFDSLATDPRANYVIQVLCQKIPNENYGDLVKIVAPSAVALSTHKHGAYILQNVLKRLPDCYESVCKNNQDNLVQQMLLSLVNCGTKLITDAHGNFTAQALIPALRYSRNATHKFVHDLKANFVEYALSEYGHCVLEEFLRIGGMENNKHLLSRFLRLNAEMFWDCISTDWGEFVVKHLAKACANHQERRKLYRKLQRSRIWWADHVF